MNLLIELRSYILIFSIVGSMLAGLISYVIRLAYLKKHPDKKKKDLKLSPFSNEVKKESLINTITIAKCGLQDYIVLVYDNEGKIAYFSDIHHTIIELNNILKSIKNDIKTSKIETFYSIDGFIHKLTLQNDFTLYKLSYYTELLNSNIEEEFNNLNVSNDIVKNDYRTKVDKSTLNNYKTEITKEDGKFYLVLTDLKNSNLLKSLGYKHKHDVASLDKKIRSGKKYHLYSEMLNEIILVVRDSKDNLIMISSEK